MDDLKLYGKAMQERDSLLQTVRIFSKGIGTQLQLDSNPEPLSS